MGYPASAGIDIHGGDARHVVGHDYLIAHRDLKQLIAFGVQLFMYATPVIYPLDAAPERYRRIIELNPLSSIFEAFKYATIGSGELQWGLLGYSLVFMALSMFFAVIVFNKVERTFMDTV